MLPTSPTVRELLGRYERACNFNRPVDSQAIQRNLAEFYRALKIGVPPITEHNCFKNYARAARAARPVLAAWAARAARAARPVLAAWEAWEAREAWAAWAAWEAREARAAREAREAWENSWVCTIYIGAVENNDPKTAETWRPLFEAFEAGLWVFLPMNEACPWLPLPKVRTELNSNRSRCHCGTGPAFELPQEKLWFIHGVLVPQYVVENPKAITVEDIEGEKNAEVRRVKIERYGQARYLVDADASEIHRDDYGILYRKDVPGDEPLVMVKALNSTPEENGITREEALSQFSKMTPVCHDGMMLPLSQVPECLRFKTYFLRVPPTIERAKQAIAWTFNKEEQDYDPIYQS